MIARYTRPAMGAIWSDENKYRCWLAVELAASEVLSEFGIVPASAAANLRAHADVDVERIEEIEAEVDEVAERAVALGGLVDGTVEGVSKKTTLETYPTEITDGKDHVESLSSALASAGKRVRAAIDQMDELGDADSADLLTDVSRLLDKKLWFVEAHLQGDE